MFWNAFFLILNIFDILFKLIAFCSLNSSASPSYPTLRLRNFVMLQKETPKNSFKNSLKKQSLYMQVKQSLYMQVTSDDGPKALRTLLVIHPPWKQDIYEETWKDIN